ncbi:HEAT repeat domain-containing protein [Dehalococcoidia bacterium]|nr:HEAT repeat domain-containing protein [Dehalococcoidia bacterium]MCL0104242.1 HEAT repeat domain-containing protein [Dehalococcoidia bacterium]
MTTIEEILKSKKKPKEIVELLAEALKRDKKLIAELIQCFENGTTAEKGNCMEAIEYVTKENPEFAENCLEFVIAHINCKAPRVKWEACRIIGNVAQKFPSKIQKAIPKLLENTKDKGTVVRWSAAFALTEIAKSNSEMQKELVPEFKKILERETNKGVRNIYLKYLKDVGL